MQVADSEGKIVLADPHACKIVYLEANGGCLASCVTRRESARLEGGSYMPRPPEGYLADAPEGKVCVRCRKPRDTLMGWLCQRCKEISKLAASRKPRKRDKGLGTSIRKREAWSPSSGESYADYLTRKY